MLDYDSLVQNPQKFILSWKGNIIGGIIVALISKFSKYKEKQTSNTQIYRTRYSSTSTCRKYDNDRISGIIGAKMLLVLRTGEIY